MSTGLFNRHSDNKDTRGEYSHKVRPISIRPILSFAHSRIQPSSDPTSGFNEAGTVLDPSHESQVSVSHHFYVTILRSPLVQTAGLSTTDGSLSNHGNNHVNPLGQGGIAEERYDGTTADPSYTNNSSTQNNEYGNTSNINEPPIYGNTSTDNQNTSTHQGNLRRDVEGGAAGALVGRGLENRRDGEGPGTVTGATIG